MNLKKDDNHFLISKVMDKFKLCETRNKIENTDFLDENQKKIVSDFLRSQKYKHYLFYGGIENAERNVLVVFPDKLEQVMENSEFDFNNILDAIRIELPDEEYNKYTHRNYLGALMKLGVKREKIGDIIVKPNGADIIISKEITKFLLTNLNDLIRFKKAQISQINLQDIVAIAVKKEEYEITIPSMRLDNIVSELAKCSRSKAVEIIFSERVFINYETVTKVSKEVKENDKITIRGKGKFEIVGITGNTKKNRIVLKVSQIGGKQ